MRKRYKNTFRNKFLNEIRTIRKNVILRSDLKSLASSRQISRALKECVEDGILVRIGRGIYAKTRKSKYTDGPIIRGSFEEVCIEALARLNIRWEPGRLIKDYNEGRSQQVLVHLQMRNSRELKEQISVTAHIIGLAPYVIEKDIYVTKAIATLSQVSSEYFELVFQGGTSLAKARRVATSRHRNHYRDANLVRHLCDLYRINELGHFTGEFSSLAQRIVLDDRKQYRNHNDDYYCDPVGEIKCAIEELRDKITPPATIKGVSRASVLAAFSRMDLSQYEASLLIRPCSSKVRC